MSALRYVLQSIACVIFRISFIALANLRVQGAKNLKGLDMTRGVIFASNHSSQIDTLLFSSALPLFSKFFPMYFVSLEKKYYSRFPLGKYIYGGIFFWILGGVTAKKELRNYALSLINHVEILRNGGSLCIYPEGQVIPGRGVGPAKGGVAYLAESTGAVIVPVTLNDNHDLTTTDFFLMRRNMSVQFGKPTTFNELYDEVLVDLASEGVSISSDLLVKNRYKAVAQRLIDRINKMIPD